MSFVRLWSISFFLLHFKKDIIESVAIHIFLFGWGRKCSHSPQCFTNSHLFFLIFFADVDRSVGFAGQTWTSKNWARYQCGLRGRTPHNAGFLRMRASRAGLSVCPSIGGGDGDPSSKFNKGGRTVLC